MKRFFLALALLLVSAQAWANTCPSYPYTLTNGTTADASQVMGNFNTIMNCASFYVGGTSTGTASAQVLASVSPGVFTLTAGNRVTFIAGFASSGATTLNVASTGAVNVYKKTPTGLVALSANDMVANQVYTVQFDGTQYELLDPVSATGTIVLRGYLGGLTLSNDGTAPNSVLDVAAGQAADSSNAVYIALPTFTKSTAGSWTSGSGNNGMGSGLTIAANTWYHVFAIVNGGNADVYFDTSVSAANEPSGTTAIRRIGSFKTDGSAHILAFAQSGDRFDLGTPLQEYDGTPGVTTAQTVTLGGVPTGVGVQALLSGAMVDATSSSSIAYLSSLAQADITPSASALTAQSAGTSVAPYATSIVTNTSAQIRRRMQSTTGLIIIITNGWFDTRGRLN